MKAQCPQCQTELVRVRAIELPPDASSDEITVSLAKCPGCQLLAIGLYEESRRGSLDSESWSSRMFRAVPTTWEKFEGLIGSCPEPTNPRCPCPGHREIGARDDRGHWNGLGDAVAGPPFFVQHSS